MSLTINFTGWRNFTARINQPVIKRFLVVTGKESEKAFKRGIASPKAGRTYTGNSGRRIRASAPGQYPAKDTGNLEASIKTVLRPLDVTIGTTMYYARFLREGTRFMARRKMSDNALQEGIKAARPKLKGFVTWKHR